MEKIFLLLAEASPEVPDLEEIVKQNTDLFMAPIWHLFSIVFGFLGIVLFLMFLLLFFLHKWKLKKDLGRDATFGEIMFALIDRLLDNRK